MKQYHDLCEKILSEGVYKDDRTKTGTLSIFGYQMRFDLSKGFPLITTKKVHMKSIIYELLWFIKGDTNIKYLVEHGVNIWNDWPYQNYKNSSSYAGETMHEFLEKIKTDANFANLYGDLGPVYGKQWRDFDGVDQIKNLIDEIKKNPNSRRLIISAWNPPEADKMVLPPCHAFLQFYVNEGKLSLQLYQRSGDVFLGIPFNIASYSLLLAMVAQVTNLKVGEFIHTIGDAHIYSNHIEQVKKQLARKERPLPQLKLNPNINNIFDFKYDDIGIIGYDPHPRIKAEVAV